MLFTVHRPNGQRTFVFRPDATDPANPGLKYEAACKKLGGLGNVLYVHPSQRHLIGDRRVPVVYVEGIKKALAIVSAALAAGVDILVVAILGVWNFLSNGEPICDMFDIPVDNRKVIILFDSDMLHNPNVQGAARRLAELLIEWGADSWLSYLHDRADGSKTGADDFFAAGGTFAELWMLTRRYDPRDFVTVRLSRCEWLRLALEDLERRFWDFKWKGMGGHSARDVYLKLTEAARSHGQVVDDGIRVTKAQGPLALEAKVSTRTLWKALNKLEEWQLIRRDNKGRKPDKSGAFVLRANVRQYGEERRDRRESNASVTRLYACDLHLRAPRLRWSTPRFTPRRGVVEGTRRVRRSVKAEPREPIKRLGKICGAILDVLDKEGPMDINELAAAIHRRRARDLRRRNLPMLEDAGILNVADDGVVHLAEDWLERLDDQRELGKELEADALDTRRYKLKSRAYHGRDKVKPALHWTNTDADGAIKDLRPADEPKGDDLEEVPLSPLATAVRDYLGRNPHDACQPLGWIGTTLWAYDLYLDKPTAADVQVAVDELGGQAYLRERLGAAKVAA
jgi:hypothetical protein